MIIKFTDQFRRQYKKAEKRIKNSFEQNLAIFTKNPMNPQLNNHPLRKPYEGHRSIDVTADWRAIYYKTEDDIIYFTAFGIHKYLYRGWLPPASAEK